LAWIRSVEPEEATPVLAPIYAAARSRSARGEVAAVWRALGLDPAGLDAGYRHYRALMDDPTPLTRAQAEMIAVVVSATNGCGYCVAHHGPRLARALDDAALARAVAADYRAANLSARDRVMLDYAVSLTCEPSERTRQDVERVQEYGFDDGAALKVTEIAAYYGYVNRVVCALGVELEPGVEAWEYGSQR
jgi:uncharacterized peroxidase-related enzyme